MTTLNVPQRPIPPLQYIQHAILIRIMSQPLTAIEIFELLTRETSGQLVLSPGTLYTALRHLLAQQLIETGSAASGEAHPSRAPRRWYRATPLGREKLMEMQSWLQWELTIVAGVLGQAEAPPPALRTVAPIPSILSRRRSRRHAYEKSPEATELTLA